MILGLYFAVLVIATITCEPPVNNYLPPGSGNGSRGRPASQYGPPESNQGGLDGFNSGRGQPRASFGSFERGSSGLPFTEYGTPEKGSQGFQGSSRGRQREGSPPSSQHTNLNQQVFGRTRGGFNSGRESSQRIESSYGTPSQEFQPSEQNGFNNQGATSQRQGSRRQLGGSPTSTYGTPDFGNDRYNTDQNYRRSGVDDSNEPAKYEFSYEVDDAEKGTMFGHSEQRDGDLTTGKYNVVLPDGRKQVVEYEANKDGYRPQIRYEGSTRRVTGSGFGRGTSGGNEGQGYSGVETNANAFANSQSETEQQGGRYQQPVVGGYASGRPSENGQDSFNNQGLLSSGVGGGYPGNPVGSNLFSRSQGVGFSSDLARQGHSISPQEGRGPLRREGLISNNGGSDEGYPSGGPLGPRGSGY